MIVYGTFTETSVSKLFMAGIVPGLLLTALFMAYVLVHALLRPEIAPREKGPQNLAEFVHGARPTSLPFAVVIGGTMGSLYFGWATPTEAAAIGCLAGVRRLGDLGQARLAGAQAQAMISSVMISGNILLIVYTAFVFSMPSAWPAWASQLTSWMVGLNLSRLEFFFALFILYTILGCLVESLGMIVITVPLLYPVLLKYGIDPVWFGIILVLFIELGQISPPIGINLFVIQSIWDGKLSDIVWRHDPVPSPDVRPADRPGILARDRAVAAQSHECASMTGPSRSLSDRAEGRPDPPSRAAPAHGSARHRRGAGRLRLHHRAAGRGRGLRRALHHGLRRLDEQRSAHPDMGALSFGEILDRVRRICDLGFASR